MSARLENDRKHAALVARRHFQDVPVDADRFIETFGSSTDPLIAELCDLIAHEPERPRAEAGADSRPYLKGYWPHVESVLEQLEKGRAGSLPERGRFSVPKLFVHALTVVCAAAPIWASFERLYPHFTRAKVLDGFTVAWAVIGGIAGLFITTWSIVALVTSIRLYQRERSRRIDHNQLQAF